MLASTQIRESDDSYLCLGCYSCYLYIVCFCLLASQLFLIINAFLVFTAISTVLAILNFTFYFVYWFADLNLYFVYQHICFVSNFIHILDHMIAREFALLILFRFFIIFDFITQGNYCCFYCLNNRCFINFNFVIVLVLNRFMLCF